MTSRKIVLVLVAATLAAGLSRAQFTQTYTAAASLAIPPSGSGGAPGGTSNPLNATVHAVNVTNAVTITNVSVETAISHSAVGDLRIEIAHCGTTVVIYDQSPASTANLGGLYQFDDGAATTFVSAITAAGNGTVPSGPYRPVSLLSAFDGQSSAGAWTITVYDLAATNTGTLTSLRVYVTGVTQYGSNFAVIPIADGSGASCLDPAVKVVNVGTHRIVENVVVHVYLEHTFVSDLEITLQHGNVSVALTHANQLPVSSGNLLGTYGFWDGAATALATVQASYAGNAVIPPLTYQPAGSLSALAGLDQFGPWYLIACDRAAGDVGHLGAVILEISHSPYDLQVAQPAGPASFVLVNSGGVPGSSFVNLFTLAQGSAPYGWIYGLDIALSDVITQVTFGPPYTGTIGPCGQTTFAVPGPIPSGLTVWGVSIELDATLTPVASRPVFSYTTL